MRNKKTIRVTACLFAYLVGFGAVETAALTWTPYGPEDKRPEPPLPMLIDSTDLAGYRGHSRTVGIRARADAEVTGGQILHLHVRAKTLFSEDESLKGMVRILVGLRTAKGKRHSLYQQTIPFTNGEAMDFHMPIRIQEERRGRQVTVDLQCGRVRQRIEFQSPSASAIRP